jgi:sortase A
MGRQEQAVVLDRPVVRRPEAGGLQAARRALRILGTLLVIAGILSIAWTILVWRWQDPFTALYTHYEQQQLSASLERQFSAARPIVRKAASAAAQERAVAKAAAAYRHTAHVGQAIGRISVPRLGLNMVLVNGTDHDTLMKGPGRDLRTSMPGQGRLVYVAGHRTTYLAPFSHIDELRKGDRITVRMPYATFVYAVTGERVVTASDLSVLRSHGYEQIVLQACHPRFFATHRYLVYAVPIRVTPAGGRPFRPTQLAAKRPTLRQ